ncbi:MAG: Gfo/Idh/MocA family oxidoreductase [Armatimonadia bacterium]
MPNPINITLVGTNNFAGSHLGSIRRMEEEGLAKQVGAVIRRPDVYADKVAEFQARGITVYNSYAEMLEREQGRTQLVSLPVAIPDHAETTIAALEAGYDVLLEKPPAPVIQQIDAMLEAEKRTGHFCCVGFQNQSKCTVRAIKRALGEGRFGDLQRINVMAEWIRPDSYYERNAWAGKVMFEGKYCLDGPTCNALAHYLFNALYWASPEWGKAAEPTSVRGELYHAHPIDSVDTSALAVHTDTGVDITYLTTLAGWSNRGPFSRLIGTKATCDWAISGDATVTYADGRQEVIADDGSREHDEVFRNCIKYLQGEAEELNCPLAMTRPYVLALNGAWESSGGPRDIPAESVTREPKDNSIFTGLNGIPELLDECYNAGKLYSDAGAPWAVATRPFDLKGYREFAMAF